MDRKRKYIAIVLLSALVVAYESVAIELALNTLSLDLFLVGSMPSIFGGIIIISLYPRQTAAMLKKMGRKDWAFLTLLSIFAAIGVLGWYDAVAKIGAGKEAILGGGSSEVLFVVILSAVFLGERLKRIEVIGSILVLLGVFLVLVNKDVLTISLSQGEIEAIVSSFFLGASAVMIARVLREYDVIPVSGVELIFSGLILLAIGVALLPINWPDAAGWLVMVALGLFPALGISTYYAGLQGIGASLTSVLFSLNGVMTVVAQISIMLIAAITVVLPDNLLLALIGGIVAIIGVYLLNMKPGEHAPGPSLPPP